MSDKFELMDGGHCYLRVIRDHTGKFVIKRWPERVSADILVLVGLWADTCQAQDGNPGQLTATVERLIKMAKKGETYRCDGTGEQEDTVVEIMTPGPLGPNVTRLGLKFLREAAIKLQKRLKA
jgi:hypothetical protein